jgi:hypothetical protein
MKWIVGVLILSATVLGWIGTAAIPVATITPDEAILKYFPEETDGLAFIDAAALRGAPLVQDVMFKGDLKKLPADIGGFADATGFDPRRDLDRVTIGKIGQRDRLIVAKAHFDKFKAEQFLKDSGKQDETYLGRVIYHDHDGAIAFLDNVVLLGTDNSVKKAIDQITYPGSVHVRSELLDDIRTIEAGNQVWAVGDFSIPAIPDLPPQAGPLAGIMKSLRRGTYQMRIDRDIHARAKAEFTDTDSARNLGDMARGFIAVAKLQIAKENPDFLQVLDGIQFSNSGSSLTVRVDESGDVLKTLQNARIQPHLGQR